METHNKQNSFVDFVDNKSPFDQISSSIQACHSVFLLDCHQDVSVMYQYAFKSFLQVGYSGYFLTDNRQPCRCCSPWAKTTSNRL